MEETIGITARRSGLALDVEDVAQFAAGLDGVVVARHYTYMCSDPGQALIKDDIRKLDLDRVVVASCSPLMHETTFRNACAEAGLNPYLFQMTNIREHVSWVTDDPARATEKARGLVSAAVRRVRYQDPLEMRQVAMQKAALVVGGGIAVAASEDISRHVQTVPAEAVRPGAWVQVLAGERLPVDGDVLHGSSMLDMSLLTGESAPRAVGPGAAVYAGTTNIEAPVLIVAERTGVHTRVAQLMDKVEQAVRSRAPVVLLADRLAARFVAAVLVLAAVAFALHASRNVATAAEHAVAVLVVSCPCALGLATPLAVSVALGRAARSGILIKGGRAIELLASSHLVVFDKTGTLTQGKLELVDFHGDASVKSLVRSLEEHSAHPAASGLVRAFGDAPRSPVSDIQQQTGGGIQGSVAGRIVR